jgi:hypothetical protein
MKPQAWLSNSLRRLYPLDPAGTQISLNLLAARGERVSFQAGFKLPAASPAESHASAKSDNLSVTVRRVGSVPVPQHNTDTPPEERDGVGRVPGYVPDILYPQTSYRAPAEDTGAFWFTVDVPPGTRPGKHEITLELNLKDGPTETLRATVDVADIVLQRRQNFPVTHWFYADAICDWYKVRPWDEAFWPLCEKYMRNYASHGLDMIYVPVFTPPLDGVKRPTQLLGVTQTGGGATAKYTFDWTNVRRWIKLAQSCGIDKWEWTHWFTQWGVKHAIRIYRDTHDDTSLLWPPETGATSDVYRNFLSQFLPELHRFIQQEGIEAGSYFHVSDEPHGEEHLANYRAARAMLRELAPWMKVMDALSELRYGKEGLTDTPIPSIQTALQYVDAKIPSWCYYCCGPRGRYLNRLLDSPLTKIRMNGWLFYRWNFRGFLHWGYNYWYKSQTRQLIDPYFVTDGLAWPGWAYGDTFVVYPGPPEVGPIDSIRWEVFAESLQDYALLQTLGVPHDGPLLADLKSFEDFPKNEAWIESARRRLLSGGGARSKATMEMAR